MNLPPSTSNRFLPGESAPFLELLECIPSPLEIYLPDGTLLMANAAARNLPTFPKDADNDHCIKAAHEDDRTAFLNAITKRTACAAPDRSYPNTLTSKPWNIMRLRTLCTPVCDAEGQIRHVIVSREDITALHTGTRFQRLVEDANEAVLVIQDGRIKFFNRTALAITGYSPEAYLSQPFHAFIHPEDREMVMHRSLLRMQGKDVPNIYQFRVIDVNGEAKWLQINAGVIEWGGRPAILAFLPDITQLRQTEMALWESEIRFQMISENTGDLIILSDGLGKTIFVNSALTRLLEIKAEELQGRSITEIIHPKYRSALSGLWNRILARKNVSPQETLLVRKDGSHLPAEISCFAIEQENSPPYLGAILRDISARKAAEYELEQYRESLEKIVGERTSELTETNAKLQQTILRQELAEENLTKEKNTLEAVFAAMSDGLSVHDRDFRILFQNAVLSKRYGDCAGQLCYVAYHGRETPCTNCGLMACIKDGAPHWFEMNETNDQGNLFFEMGVSPVRDGKGTIIAAVEVIRDITDQKRLADQLLQSQKMEAIGTLAGGIAHDFNNILTAILGYAELSKFEAVPDSELAHNLAEIIGASRRAGDLIRQILTFSRRAEFKKQPLQIHSVVKEALKLIRGTIPSTIDIRQEIDGDCGTIMADVTQIHQIVMNLCTNAYHAMQQQGGLLVVRLQNAVISRETLDTPTGLKPGNYVRLTVSDTGHGIDENTLDRVFDPYFTTKKQGEGTGLGLATVHGIVENHEGVISVKSAINEGTTFDIYFPRVETDFAAALTGWGETGATSRQARILLVDDEEMLIRLGTSILKKLGHTVTALNNSQDALDLFKKDPLAFDLLLTDQMMPGLTGLELTKECLAIRPDLPVVLATGYSEATSKEQAQAQGISAILWKPVTINTMAETIQQALGKKE
ncbi:PAS domain-containing hybrid sensor histidine kinase/response regulator [Thiovibrio frasassiensis]|uniref:histidine kinase n=1 Tax=Thiovibrio frasassiensis TaxID=2984131 RepID=A0A9X4RN37_9BACT|nr:PAS domain S-box protein [Thiovibrio frasassiensis]MDG4476885.1 PAS domain S-box protein [Thiovibrio frasassiensis]